MSNYKDGFPRGTRESTFQFFNFFWMLVCGVPANRVQDMLNVEIPYSPRASAVPSYPFSKTQLMDLATLIAAGVIALWSYE